MNIPDEQSDAPKRAKNFFTVNVALKVIAFIFAMLLWGCMLTDQKPMRTKKEITNVATSFEGEAELIAQVSAFATIAPKSCRMSPSPSGRRDHQHAYINASSVSFPSACTQHQRDAGVRSADTGDGCILARYRADVLPATVKVEIDALVTKTIPICHLVLRCCRMVYWADMDAMTTTSRIDITGPKTDISEILHTAKCVVDLNDKTGTIYSTLA
ncbi:MAG: hypothetical protein R2912_08755 [Eubacteriales bacterium]